MGLSEGEGLDDEQPRHKVYLDAYYLDKYEVTTERYAKFLEFAGWQKPLNWSMVKFPDHANRPVIGVSWIEPLRTVEHKEIRRHLFRHHNLDPVPGRLVAFRKRVRTLSGCNDRDRIFRSLSQEHGVGSIPTAKIQDLFAFEILQ